MLLVVKLRKKGSEFAKATQRVVESRLGSRAGTLRPALYRGRTKVWKVMEESPH